MQISRPGHTCRSMNFYIQVFALQIPGDPHPREEAAIVPRQRLKTDDGRVQSSAINKLISADTKEP